MQNTIPLPINALQSYEDKILIIATDSSLTTAKTAIEFKGVDFHLEKAPHKT